jgi:hypothetical protein
MKTMKTNETIARVLRQAWILETAGDQASADVLHKAYEEILALQDNLGMCHKKGRKQFNLRIQQLRRSERMERLIQGIAKDLRDGVPIDRIDYLIGRSLAEIALDKDPEQ